MASIITSYNNHNFFGTDDVDYDISVKQLKDRLKRIAQANPWLVGRIAHNKKNIWKKMTTTRAYKSLFASKVLEYIFCFETS